MRASGGTLFLYSILRSYGNGRLQAAWKTLGDLCGRPGVYMSPTKWRWPAS